MENFQFEIDIVELVLFKYIVVFEHFFKVFKLIKLRCGAALSRKEPDNLKYCDSN